MTSSDLIRIPIPLEPRATADVSPRAKETQPAHVRLPGAPGHIGPSKTATLPTIGAKTCALATPEPPPAYTGRLAWLKKATDLTMGVVVGTRPQFSTLPLHRESLEQLRKDELTIRRWFWKNELITTGGWGVASLIPSFASHFVDPKYKDALDLTCYGFSAVMGVGIGVGFAFYGLLERAIHRHETWREESCADPERVSEPASKALKRDWSIADKLSWGVTVVGFSAVIIGATAAFSNIAEDKKKIFEYFDVALTTATLATQAVGLYMTPKYTPADNAEPEGTAHGANVHRPVA